MNPKTEPAFPVVSRHPVTGEVFDFSKLGLSQYAEIAARFYAMLIPEAEKKRLAVDMFYAKQVAITAFNHTDAFFTELAKRTNP